MDPWIAGAAIFMVVSVALTFYAIINHLLNFNKPYLQRYIIRILLMVPIYSLNAWIAMILPVAGLYLDVSREVYESFVIYSFMKYLLNFLHFDTNLQQYIDHKPGVKHFFPFCLLPSLGSGRIFMSRCKDGILQYVVVRPITTLIAFASQVFGFYGEGNYNPLSGYTFPLLLIVNNISQITAMYCLVIFYTGYRQELNPMRPLAKFFSIKLVVFFSFFQSVLIAGLLEIPLVEEAARGLFPEVSEKLLISRKLQEFLICFDMLVAAIGHQFAFSHKPFEDDDSGSMLDGVDSEDPSVSPLPNRFIDNSKNCCQAACNIFDFSDERTDVSEHFSHLYQRIQLLFRRERMPTIVSSETINQSSENISSSPNKNYESIR